MDVKQKNTYDEKLFTDEPSFLKAFLDKIGKNPLEKIKGAISLFVSRSDSELHGNIGHNLFILLNWFAIKNNVKKNSLTITDKNGEELNFYLDFLIYLFIKTDNKKFEKIFGFGKFFLFECLTNEGLLDFIDLKKKTNLDLVFKFQPQLIKDKFNRHGSPLFRKVNNNCNNFPGFMYDLKNGFQIYSKDQSNINEKDKEEVEKYLMDKLSLNAIKLNKLRSNSYDDRFKKLKTKYRY